MPSIEVPMETQEQRKPVRLPAVTQKEVPMETQEKGNLENIQGWFQVNCLC